MVVNLRIFKFWLLQKKILSLDFLSISYLHDLSDTILESFLAANGRSLSRLILNDCSHITYIGVKKIVEFCAHLSELHVSMTPFTMRSLSYISRLNLRKLDFSDQQSVSDVAIAAFMDASGASLIYLNLRHTTTISYHTANAIALKCQNLRILDVSFCLGLTDNELGNIADRCMLLEEIHIMNCHKVTHKFRNGHSNSCLKIIHNGGTNILTHTPSALRFSPSNLATTLSEDN
ncbi:F-box/LRR-repeat protein 4-like [Chenopodium quinoa]|uniref:F-box/LRR-repeat protein 4-like n=1 Tax=Chenopodium quinoa TaxID=63459 RepID=UPI000B77BBE0|nr:F-box/LRR-repeat protein 4-like [Chenopodium quinoa]